MRDSWLAKQERRATVRIGLVPLRKPAVLVREETQSLRQDVKAPPASLPEDNAKPESQLDHVVR